MTINKPSVQPPKMISPLPAPLSAPRIKIRNAMRQSMAPKPIRVSPTALRGFSRFVFMAEAKHTGPTINRYGRNISLIDRAGISNVAGWGALPLIGWALGESLFAATLRPNEWRAK